MFFITSIWNREHLVIHSTYQLRRWIWMMDVEMVLRSGKRDDGESFPMIKDKDAFNDACMYLTFFQLREF